ncbi:unnamed protein product [Amoebophrya sp. A120]|nr:unnamed protein product [Amoebophrya sp. A120]|eukprot:GSA120T00007271001.1
MLTRSYFLFLCRLLLCGQLWGGSLFSLLPHEVSFLASSSSGGPQLFLLSQQTPIRLVSGYTLQKDDDVATDDKSRSSTTDTNDLHDVETQHELKLLHQQQEDLAWLQSLPEDGDDPEWFAKGMPPPGWLKRLKAILNAREEHDDASGTSSPATSGSGEGEAKKQDANYEPPGTSTTSASEAALLPQQKYDDQWTVSPKFRQDLVQFFQNVKRGQANMMRGTSPTSASDEERTRPIGKKDVEAKVKTIIFELGTYIGYTTRFLSQHFTTVFALDVDPVFLRLNKIYNSDRRNIHFLQVDSPNIDWATLYQTAKQATKVQHLIAKEATAPTPASASASTEGQGSSGAMNKSTTTSVARIYSVFLDASHDFLSVCRELKGLLLSIPKLEFLVFDDFSAEPLGVQIAVLLFIRKGFLRREKYIGEESFRLKDGRRIEGPEGVICRNSLFNYYEAEIVKMPPVADAEQKAAAPTASTSNPEGGGVEPPALLLPESRELQTSIDAKRELLASDLFELEVQAIHKVIEDEHQRLGRNAARKKAVEETMMRHQMDHEKKEHDHQVPGARQGAEDHLVHPESRSRKRRITASDYDHEEVAPEFTQFVRDLYADADGMDSFCTGVMLKENQGCARPLVVDEEDEEEWLRQPEDSAISSGDL